MRDQTASLLIGTLADQVLDDIEAGVASPRGSAAAERLEKLLALAVAYRSGVLSEMKQDPDVSASAAHSFLATAGLRLGALREGVEGLDVFRHPLVAVREGNLDPDARNVLVPFLQLLASASANAARESIPAFFPGETDRRRRSWINR